MTETSPKPIVTTAPFPANEVERLEALRRYNILDTPPEVAFDRITSLAARLFNMPITLVSLVDESRGWFKSAYGFDMREVQRDTTICSFALLSNEVLVIPDTRQDSRLVCNPFVQNEPGLRFYAGAPLLTQDGFNLGTLCLLDTKPRDGLSDEQKSVLTDLAAMVMDELELRLAAHKVAQMDAALLEVTQGVSTATGEAFFSALVQHMLKVLGVDYVYIGLVDLDNQEIIRTIAACAKGQIIENFEYLLRETPCEQVLQKRKLCCYPHRVQALFPKAPLLEPLGVESYVAVPFFDTIGLPLGLLGVMDGNALTNVQLAESLLTIFALRIATELERQQTEAARQQAQYELERLVEKRTTELSQANELLKVLLDNVQAGIVACDAEGILTLFNQAAREFHGLPEQALPPEKWAEHYDLYLPDGKTRMSKNEIPLFQVLQEQTVKNVEMVIAPKHGKVKTLLASGQAIVDNEGKKQGAVVVMHDITERKIAEAELLISDVALQQMPDAILLTDLECNIQRWLGNAEQIFGYTAAEVIGKPVSFLHHPDIKSTQTAEIIRDLQETGAFCSEIACLRKDGSPVPIETTAKTVYDKAGNAIFIISINRDITERKQAEAERTQLMRQQVQEQSARLKAEEANRIKDEFLAVLSHELRTPLNPILGWTKLLRAGKLDSAKTDYALETIERNAKLQTQLIGDLLDVSRILQGKLSLSMATVNLAPTISAAIETVQLAAQAKSIQIKTVFDPNVGQVLGDSARLQQVFWNLLSNAVKFTENGGRVEIRLGCVDSQAEIKVSDTGKGISPDFLPHVFESFRQADATITRKFGGLGLGLAIVRHLVELHGGTIYAESPGEDLGATFTVRLPLIAVVKTC
ncbi:hypothetical protein DSM106972_013160 [Dulcicalothrix desertica PCC 7102]|uniref:Circadian input-output histidine kinase CikA n=1 Tax=Dulcicalothrix desertica PCC 7102 TaxID=232991 RepID=A0A3S1APR7_9CYAN|nr:PAS domain S-box protein [Dulcicalothrix desertica]RUT08148.1 hypothetical protein DSM106972_013160 [Dulcicalothrix desertica PCC 7102]TWH40018.1 PAS domain S-box-containing protein [Dulcicalothrix desertica PCC 7102]